MRPLALCLALTILAGPALAGEVAKPTAATPEAKRDERPRITLTWSTASEMDNYGFFVKRADDEKGPFKALNVKILPGGGNSDVPLEYKYVDENVVMGKTYFYYLESVSTTGVKEKFSPTLKKVCCKTAKDPGKPAEKVEEPAKKAPKTEAAAPKTR
jgi:hypothetical protein